MNATARQLLDMKEQIEKAKTNKAQTEGRIQVLMERLDKEHGCETIAEAERAVDKLDKELIKMERQLTVAATELEGAYDWNS